MFNWNISDSYLDIRCEICTLAPVAAVNVAKTVMQVLKSGKQYADACDESNQSV